MATDHHFVPQFFFRNFSQDGTRINLLHRASERIISNTSIRHQAQKKNFYGSAEIEKQLSHIEGHQATAIRRLLGIAKNPGEMLRQEELIWLLNFILIQRSRTPYEANKTAEYQEVLASEWLSGVLDSDEARRSLPQSSIEAFKSGQIELKINPEFAVLSKMEMAFNAIPLLQDLKPVVLRNHTRRPFIFSDSPVVSINQFQRNVVSRGVLGLQSPGIQIFVPLSSSITLMFFDAERYSGAATEDWLIDIVHVSDVGFLNALQVHNSNATIYFSDVADADYVTSIHKAQLPRILDDLNVVQRYEPIGENSSEVTELIHTFERQLNVNPTFTFLDCEPAAAEEELPNARNESLVDQFKSEADLGDAAPVDDGVRKPLRLRSKAGKMIDLNPRIPD